MTPVACRVFGHRFRFTTEGPLMRWSCERGCGAGGSKQYASEEAASRYASVFDREDRAQQGRHPTLSLLPLWAVRRFRQRRRDRR